MRCTAPLLALLLLCSCSGQPAAPPVSTSTGPLDAFPQPASLTRHTSASAFLDTDSAGFYESPRANVAYDGLNLRFSPQWDPATPSLAAAGIAVFEFWAPEGVHPPVIEGNWLGVQPQEGEVCYGVANWAAGRWDWLTSLNGNAGPLTAACVHPETASVVIAVVVLTDHDLVLRNLRLGPGGIAELSLRSMQPTADVAARRSIQALAWLGGAAIFCSEAQAVGADIRHNVVVYECLSPDGFIWRGPTTVYENPNLNTPVDLRCGVVDGFPAVAVLRSFGGTSTISYVGTTDTFLDNWNDPAEVFSDSWSNLVELVDLIEVDQSPAMVFNYGGGVSYSIARDAEGTDWRPSIFAATDARAFDAMVVEGRAAFGAYLSGPPAHRLHFYRAADIIGQDWPTTGVEMWQSASALLQNSPRMFQVHDGRPAVLFQLPDGLHTAYAQNLAGTGWVLPQNIDPYIYEHAAASAAGAATYITNVGAGIPGMQMLNTTDVNGEIWNPAWQIEAGPTSQTDLEMVEVAGHLVVVTSTDLTAGVSPSHLLVRWL